MSASNNSVPRYPPPPQYYKTFISDEDVRRAPPKPPVDDKKIFNVLGRQWSLEQELPMSSTYGDKLRLEFIVLQKAMREVLETLQTEAKEGYMDDVAAVNNSFEAMTTLLRSYRYHEARAAVVEHLEKQIQCKESSIKDLDDSILEIREELRKCV
eukprot:g13678.t1